MTPENNAPSVAPESTPFDLKNLESRLISKGMPAVEGLAKDVFNEFCLWIEEGVKASPSKIDDFALAVLPPFRAFVLSKLEGISK